MMGGGILPPKIPVDIDELTRWLADATSRVILLDRTFDFSDAEGTVTEQGCRPPSNTCPCNGDQDAINIGDWCQQDPRVSVTYNKVAMAGLEVNSNKTLLGKGKAGVLKGKGLRITSDASNIIIQNIHITSLNPQYIWGGDAIAVAGGDLVWIDHCKFSLLGRQMIVTGYEKAGRMTISNKEFDGLTSWSASCDEHHYWTLFFIGSSDQITLQNNYIHYTSGRGPKVGGSNTSDVLLHAATNYWTNTTGITLEDHIKAHVLLEGNYFENVSYPRTPDADGQVFARMEDASICQANKISGPTKSPLTGNDTSVPDYFIHTNPPNAMSWLMLVLVK